MRKNLQKIILIFIISLLIGQGGVQAQKSYLATGDKKIAQEFFLFGDYVTALKEYQYLYALDSNNPEFYYPLGVCYLNTNIDKLKSIPFFEKVMLQKDFDPEAYYQMANAYQVAMRFDDAIEYYRKFIAIAKGNDLNYIPAKRCIEMCENAIELIKTPINITFENVGSRINSPYPDYSPFINKNETILYFASKRPGNIGGMVDFDGYNTADVFYCESKYGQWAKSKRLASTINTPLVEEIAGLSADGSHLFIFLDNLEVKAQTQVSIKKGKSFMNLIPLGPNVNVPNNGANAACITPDKKILFFSSTKDGATAGSDIFMSKKLPSGQWGIPENLGKGINTEYDEDFPSLSPDGKTLYFASAGHNSMGGLDIFRTEWDRENNTFSEPVNMGYPLNTPEDNTTICFSNSGRYAYISTLRNEDTYGNLDIYRVIFNDVKAGSTTLKAILTNKDSVNVFEVFNKETKKTIDSLTEVTDPVYVSANVVSDSLLKAYKSRLAIANSKIATGPEIRIKVQKASDMTFVGTYKPNRASGKFVVILPPEKYIITINCEGYQEYKETFRIEDRETPVKEILKSFQLTQKI